MEDTSIENSHKEDVETSDSFTENQNNYHEEGISKDNIGSSYEEISHINNEYNQEVITPELNEEDVSVSKSNIVVIESELVNINVIEDFEKLTNDIDETDENELISNENSVYEDLFFFQNMEVISSF